jgi:hypothetical protein
MYTEERLFAYLQHFERDFGKCAAKIIDATEGGARKRGAIVMPLAQVIEQHCPSPLPASPPPPSPADWSVLPACIESLKSRQDEALEIEQISRQTLPLLEEIRDHLSDQPRVNRAIGRIDELRIRMDVLGQTYSLVMQLTQSTELKRFEEDRRIAAARLNGIEKQRGQVIRDIENVKAVIEAAAAFRALMIDVIEHIRREHRQSEAP